MNSDPHVDLIPESVAVTLDGLFRERVRRSPDAEACREFDGTSGVWRSRTWAEMYRWIGRWQAAMTRDGLHAGDRVAVMLRNCPAWVAFDQAALGLGLVVVPLYTSDRPDNVAYVLRDSGSKLLLIEGAEQWAGLREVRTQMEGVARIVSLNPVQDPEEPRLRHLDSWLPAEATAPRHLTQDPNLLASIIYTSGTTGRPKGVMLSHRNMLSNAAGALATFALRTDDVCLSFLPLSHTFERTIGYYAGVMGGGTTVYSRSIPQLAEDLQIVRPTVLVSVPRIFERVHAAVRAKLAEGPALRSKLFDLAVDVGYSRFEHAQGRGPWRASHLLWPVLDRLVASKLRERLGGRLRVAMAGGAALSPDVSRVFVGLGITVLQGFGLTETSPVATVNRVDDNLPASVGTPIPGVEVKLGERNALLIRGPNVMLGYWNNPEATRAILSADGWLNSGDTARIDEGGHVFITGRLKEIIVLSNGEKIPPVDVENAILRDTLFEQIMLIGEGKPYLAVIAVLNRDQWKAAAAEAGLDPESPQVLAGERAEQLVLERIARQCREFPGYAQVRRAALSLDPWTVENGLLTPTLKLRRARVLDQLKAQVDALYSGH